MTDPRLQRLNEPHVAPLMAWVRTLRDHGYQVPNVDPNDGGIRARVLLLLESPGPKAVVSGFVSRDNPDPSARNMGRALDQAGLRRSDVLLWNIVPYCVSTAEQNKNATMADVRRAARYTSQLFDLIPALKVIVFCGGVAKRGREYLTIPKRLIKLETYHSGAQAYNRPALREHVHEVFQRANNLVSRD